MFKEDADADKGDVQVENAEERQGIIATQNSNEQEQRGGQADCKNKVQQDEEGRFPGRIHPESPDAG